MRTLTFNRIVGAGAMGTVYHADLKTPGGFVRPCAVKVMKATGPDREHFMARMRDEARLLGMLQDEQVLGVSELVSVGDRDAVIMDYVEGTDLADLLKVRRLPPKALAELGAEIAGVLHRAHNAKHPTTAQPLNVIHRDIKPANVMISPRGGVRLLDFGVARAAFSGRESQTQGLVLGTLNYFPPEVLGGAEPSQAVDIYGLGVTMWECATGKEWGSPQANQKRFERRVDERLSELEGEYRDLISVLRSILQWDPELRPNGGTVERALLHAASVSPGDGLRVWAREVVPLALNERDKQSNKARDELVGRTLEIGAASDGIAEPIAALQTRPPTPEPPPRAKGPSPTAPAGRAPSPTAPAGRAPSPTAPAGRAPRPAPKKAAAPASRRGSSIAWMLALGVILGLGLGVVIILVVVIVAILLA